MVAHIQTIAFSGVEALPIDVQVHLAPGQNAFTVVGLPDKSVAESRERLRSALVAIGLGLPHERITINLSPADLLKEGSHYDLPIALGLIVAMGGWPVLRKRKSRLDGFQTIGSDGGHVQNLGRGGADTGNLHRFLKTNQQRPEQCGTTQLFQHFG
jgi:magnesium chelatase family protein